MSEDLFIPKLGQTVEEVVLINWLLPDGSKVDFGDPVLEVETDKAIFNVEANARGYLHIGPYQIGETLPVLTVVATIGQKDESFSPSQNALSPESTPSETPEQQPAVSSTAGQIQVKPLSLSEDKIFASPRAQRLAREQQVNLALVQPTGAEGVRIIEKDVRAYLNQAPKATPIAAALADEVGLDLTVVPGSGPQGKITRADVIKQIRAMLASATAIRPGGKPPADQTGVQVLEAIPLQGVRKTIFNRMAASVHTTARVTLVTEADATLLSTYREKLKLEKTQVWGFTPSYNDLFGMIVAKTLQDFPYMNARLSSDEKSIEILTDINLGIAMDTPRGLMVPVIKQANMLGLYDFGTELRALIERAKNGHSSPVDLSDGTFTLTNLGNFDIDAFTPVINLPEVAILGIGKIQEQVVPYQGVVAIRKMVTLSLVFDHRMIDGAPAARFLQAVKEKISHGTIE